ncbi:MAG: hypothetical protein LC689_00110 [Myxococcales bacterium]|nr:hypothetical protein [Myxococcales bacterium]
MRGAVLGAIAGAAIATLPGRAGIIAAVVGALAGGAIGWRFARGPMGFSPWSLAVLLFLMPALWMPVAPGADMAMHVALARGLLDGVLSPAWPGVAAGAYPRGFSAVVALFGPLGLARAGLLAAGVSYLVFWAGLAAILETLRTPAARTVAAVALLLSRTPQIFFDWGGNPTALAIGLALFGAAQETAVSALYFAGASAVHPMGAVAGVLAFCTKRTFCTKGAWVPALTGVAGVGFVVGVLAVFGPRLSANETAWLRDYAFRQERVGFGVLGDAANIATALATAWLLWKRRWRPVATAAAAILAMSALFKLAPYAGLYPVRLAPMLLLVVAPLWGRAAATRIPLLGPVAIVLALPFHFRSYQGAVPIATFGDLRAIACVERSTPKNAVIDGAYGDATQWIPALADRAVTRPHLHVSLFDEMPALPQPSFRFVGDRLRYPPAIDPPPKTMPLCDGKLYPPR